MSFKPQDFFIGVTDFFSVLLPGALLTYVLLGILQDDIFGPEKLLDASENVVSQWIVFLVISYIVGNIVFMVASFLDLTYDSFLRRRFFQSEHDLPYKTARSIHWKHIDTDQTLKQLLADGVIENEEFKRIRSSPRREIFNTYKWSQHFLLFTNPDALDDVQRIEADSKFFRSLVIAFLIISGLLLWEGKIALAIISLVLSALCYYRYGDLRHKATQKAYEIVVTHHYLQTNGPAEEMEHKEAYTALKQHLTDDFVNRYTETIDMVTQGFSTNLKRLTIPRGETRILSTDQNESWFCLQGSGSLNISEGSGFVVSNLTPNAIVPIPKDRDFTVHNKTQETIEILAFEN
jgi:hypothetical protein